MSQTLREPASLAPVPPPAADLPHPSGPGHSDDGQTDAKQIDPFPRPVPGRAAPSAARRRTWRELRAALVDRAAPSVKPLVGAVVVVSALLAVTAMWWVAFAHTYRVPQEAASATVPSATAIGIASAGPAARGGVADPDADAAAPATTADPANGGRAATLTGLEPTSHVPIVTLQRLTDFTAGDPLPDGSRTYDNAGVSSPLELGDTGLTHGTPSQANAASFLETRLGSDAKVLGAQIHFASTDSGSVAVTAWQSSVVDAAATAGIPPTGMRLVVLPNGWRCQVMDADGKEDLGQGSFTNPAETGGAADVSIEIIRRGDSLWIVDPAGTVTQLSDPRVAERAGPWASWSLRESSAQQSPARIDAVWAG